MSMVDTLNSSALFEGLDNSHLEKIAVLCRSGSYREGTVIFREGDDADELYVLTEGRIALEMAVQPVPNRPAIPTAVEVVTKGECLGLSSLAEGMYTLSARCMTPCTVLAIKGDLLKKAMEEDCCLGYEVHKRLVRLVRQRLTNTRLRLTSGLGLILLGKELGTSE
ncbi:Crp/Fnr family transcriptional regulator [Chloroflexota bacterium]